MKKRQTTSLSGIPGKIDDGIPRPKNLKELPKYFCRKIENFMTHFFYTVSLVWEAAPLLLVFMIFCCVVDGILPVVGAYISKDLLNAIAELIGQTAAGETAGEIFSVFEPVAFLFVLQFVYLILRSIFQRLNVTATTLASELVSNHIRLKIIAKAKTVDQASFDCPEFYEKLENANREAGNRPIGILNATFNVISAAISIVSFIIILSTLSPWAPLVMIVAALPAAFVNYHFRRRSFWFIRNNSKERRQMNYYSGLMVDKNYSKEIKILGLGDTFVNKYETVFRRYYKGLKKIVLKEGTMRVLVGVLMALANCALFAYVAYDVVFGDGMIGDYSLYTGALSSVATYVTELVTATAMIYEGTLFIDNMINYMKEEPTVVANIAANTKEARVPERGACHKIELRNVSFTYPGMKEPVLKNVNLTFKTGESTVIVGLNGAGKTTLIKLICRLYDPTEGEIYLDGYPLKEYAPDKYYDMFGIIFQDFGRYSESASENIRFGDVNREFNKEDIEISAINSGADSFIRELPMGYDTALTRIFEENGTELSGGQWQKLSVARAFYKDSDILIMDEPTASLDAIAEQEIFNRFEKLSDGKISIFISHRLSSATTADKIVVLGSGRIVETGSHGELMEKRGEYFRLFSTQANRYMPSDEQYF